MKKYLLIYLLYFSDINNKFSISFNHKSSGVNNDNIFKLFLASFDLFFK